MQAGKKITCDLITTLIKINRLDNQYQEYENIIYMISKYHII